MIEEVRRQFREIPGLREGKEERARLRPLRGHQHGASLKEMIVPGALAAVVPLVSASSMSMPSAACSAAACWAAYSLR